MLKVNVVLVGGDQCACCNERGAFYRGKDSVSVGEKLLLPQEHSHSTSRVMRLLTEGGTPLEAMHK